MVWKNKSISKRKNLYVNKYVINKTNINYYENLLESFIMTNDNGIVDMLNGRGLIMSCKMFQI